MPNNRAAIGKSDSQVSGQPENLDAKRSPARSTSTLSSKNGDDSSVAISCIMAPDCGSRGPSPSAFASSPAPSAEFQSDTATINQCREKELPSLTKKRLLEQEDSGQVFCDSYANAKYYDANNNYKPAQVGTSNLGQQRRLVEIFSVNSTNTQTTCESSSYSLTTGKPGLLYCSREPVRLKDFRSEVRGPMDVEQFSSQAELLLDLDEVSMEGIVGAMLAKVAENDKRINGERLEQVRRAIFVPGSSALVARTIHGFQSVVEFGEEGRASDDRAAVASASLRLDQSWLCALCNLSQVSERHMVVARFRQPVNMGEDAHEVRLFVLIIAPTKEKSTKDALETGRTFATMLADAHFRHRLLHAQSPIEFRSLMMARAQQLAQVHRFRNRHKYQFEPILNAAISNSSLNNETFCYYKHNSNNNDVVVAEQTSAPSLDECAPATTVGVSRLLFNRNPRTSKLFALIGSDNELSQTLDTANKNSDTRDKFNLSRHVKLYELAENRSNAKQSIDAATIKATTTKEAPMGCCATFGRLEFGAGAWNDFTRRLKFYPSDFRDAFVGPPRTLQKTVATIWFLYFGILLPTIAFSSLNTVQTHGHMGDLRKAIIGQAIGGLIFALLGGQPLVIIMTTAPLCLYTKVVHQMCIDYGFPFPAMYAAVGLWNGFFLTFYSLFGFSKLMKWCTRSTEEIFALFIVVAFVTDASKDMAKNFRRFYFTPACEAQNNQTSNVMIDAKQSMLVNPSPQTNGNNFSSAFRDIEDEIESSVCRRETSLLFVLLMLGTLWLAVTLYKSRRTPYLSVGKRDALADYALPTAVILMSLVGSTLFSDIYVEKFPPLVDIHFERARVDLLPWTGLLTAMGLGFTLSLLFFMDQNISAAMVMAPQNKLKKGSAYHYDLLIVGVLNGFLSLYGLPMMHGVLPHSPLHARSLADYEEQVEEGHHCEVVVNARETRVTAVVAHVLVLLSLLLIPYPIAYIPRAVLNGLFLYMAVTSLDGLQVFERMLLLVTEQSKYPPNHYIRRCPQRKIHQFTMLQMVQLIVMCLFGFSPVNIVEMFFPVFILLMIPFRHKVVPMCIEEKYLDALDGKH